MIIFLASLKEKGKTMEDFLARPGEDCYADARERMPAVAAK